MRTAFFAGVLLGFAALLAAAGYLPWLHPERLPSHTTIVANGGRAETFVIRLPADRIVSAGGVDTGLRGAPFPSAAALPEALRSVPLLVEHFKVRDRDDQVIGVAARHSTSTDDTTSTAWLVVIPGRGTMLLTGEGEALRGIDNALAAAGRRPGETWSGEVTVGFPRPSAPGRLVSGTREFDRFEGTYSETWTITGVGEAGELKGTVELETVVSTST